jgi:hypothetical protein
MTTSRDRMREVRIDVDSSDGVCDGTELRAPRPVRCRYGASQAGLKRIGSAVSSSLMAACFRRVACCCKPHWSLKTRSGNW